MTTRPIWKHPADILFRGLDLAAALPAGVTIAGSPTWAVTRVDGAVISGSDLTAIHEAAAGTVATARLQLGVGGIDYLATVTAVLSNNEQLNRTITVKVRTGL